MLFETKWFILYNNIAVTTHLVVICEHKLLCSVNYSQLFLLQQ